MSRGLIFWLLMFLWLFFALWALWPINNFTPVIGNLLEFVLFGLLGWKVFGPAIRE